MWHRRWIGLAAAWIAAIIIAAIVYRIPERYEAQARVYVDTESLLKPLLARPRRPAEPRPAGRADQPYADQSSERREADPQGGSRPRREDRGASRGADRRRHQDDPAQQRVDQPLQHRLSRPEPEQAHASRAGVARHLPRIEPRRQAPGLATARPVPGRADPALRGVAARGRESSQGFQAQVHGSRGPGQRLFQAHVATAHGHRQRTHGARVVRAGAGRIQEGAGR